MFNKLTLRDRIFLISSLLVLIAVSLIWLFIKPRYQDTVVKERTTIVFQLQEYTLRQADNTVRNWLNSTVLLAQDLELDPGNTTDLANKAINYTPGLMRVLISDTQSNQEVNLVRGIYSSIDFKVDDINWYAARLDPTINTAWVHKPDQIVDFFITERAFQIGENVFRLRMYFNSQTLNDNLINIPLGGSYFTNIMDVEGNNLISGKEFNFPSDLLGDNSFSDQRIVSIGNKNWYVLSSRFETIPLWHLVAVEDSFMLEPVNRMLRFSYFTAASVLLLMLGFSWYVSFRINQPISLLLSDVDPLSRLDFSHKIKKVNLPEFHPMHNTLENIRTTLKRYQKLNVEKIILEEWKNRYMVTYSEDFIAVIDEEENLSFINNQFTQFLEDLELNPKNSSLKKILNHSKIAISKLSHSFHYPNPFTIKVDQAELKHTNKEGVNYFYDYQYLSIMDEENKQIGAYIMFHDKTEDRLLDIKRNDMINVIVHELKNPITGVVGLSKLIIDNEGMTNNEIKTLTQEVYNSGERMNKLVNRFLEVQKLEAGNINLNISKIDVRDITKEVSALSKPLLTAKDINLVVNEKGRDFTIEADKDLIFDAIQNLLSNAIKYGDPVRDIRIDFVSEEKHVEISVTDHGYGISMEDQSKIFDKFFRVKSNAKSAKEKGTGLGLAYVKEIVQRHNGEISLESNPEIGTKFTLVFPKEYSEGL